MLRGLPMLRGLMLLTMLRGLMLLPPLLLL